MITIKDWLENHMLVRRLALLWAIWLTTVVVLRVTEAETIPLVSTAIATIIVAVIGLVATAIGFYTKSRANGKG